MHIIISYHINFLQNKKSIEADKKKKSNWEKKFKKSKHLV